MALKKGVISLTRFLSNTTDPPKIEANNTFERVLRVKWAADSKFWRCGKSWGPEVPMNTSRFLKK